MKKRTVNAIKKAVLIAGIPFTLCTIIITVVFILALYFYLSSSDKE